MNIADVIEVVPPTPPASWASPKTNELRSMVPLAKRLWKNDQRIPEDEKGTFKKFVTMSEEAAEERWFLFEQSGMLPNELLEKVPYVWYDQGSVRMRDGATGWLEDLARTPKTTMAEVRKIANVLGFLVLPFGFLDPRSYKDEPADMKKAIDRFSKVGGSKGTCYVLCPIAYYDFQRHVDSESDLPIYVPPQASQAFLAVDMTIPMFRQMRAQLKAANSSLSAMDSQIQSTRRRILDLENSVAQILREQARQRAEQARLDAEQDRQRQEAEEMRRKVSELEARQFVAWEPMMLVFPSKRTVRDDGWAAIGPCWGPDFPEIVLAAAGLTEGRRKENQRKELHDQAMKFAR